MRKCGGRVEDEIHTSDDRMVVGLERGARGGASRSDCSFEHELRAAEKILYGWLIVELGHGTSSVPEP
jgi:hypothetical protein